MEFGDWVCSKREEMTEQVEKNLGVTDYLICDYFSEKFGTAVNFYVGYHQTQERSDSGKTTIIHLLTRLYDWLHHPEGAMVKPKDPLEYLHKLRFHQGVGGPGAYGLE